MQNTLEVRHVSVAIEVIFSVCRRPETSNEEFQKDTSAVESDLRALKNILEGR
jgi:hypothetical protein